MTRSRLCSGVRMSVRRKWTMKSFTTKTTLDDQQDDCVLSMINKCSKIDDDQNLPSTTCTATTKDVAADFEMSPKRALRAAMLKRRFADTIFKATHRHQTCSNKEQERELEKEKKQARQRIEAELKAAKRAAAFVDRSKKTTRENQRAAARMALEKMEKSVYIDDHASLLKQLQTLCGDSVAYELFYGKGCVGNAKFVNPLEKIGLYFKEDSLEDEEDPLPMELEEGEIFC